MNKQKISKYEIKTKKDTNEISAHNAYAPNCACLLCRIHLKHSRRKEKQPKTRQNTIYQSKSLQLTNAVKRSKRKPDSKSRVRNIKLHVTSHGRPSLVATL
jgi:hypothetical protein